MAFKKLLLGSVAAVLVAGSAQAADLYVAEPVDYVRICDAYGNTYWYSPGTNTCLSITGYVWAEAQYAQTPFPAIANTTGTYNWKMRTRAAVTVNAKSSTEWGPLVGSMTIFGTSDNAGGFGLTYQQAYFSIGNFLGGHTGSIYAFQGNVPFRVTNNLGVLRLGNIDQLRYTWVRQAWSLGVAVEDPRDRATAANAATMAFPDVVAALAFGRSVAGNSSPFGVQLSAGVGARAAGLTYGVQLGATWAVSSNTTLNFVAAYSPTSEDFVSGINAATGGISGGTFLAFGGAGTYLAVQGGIDHKFNDRWAAGLTGGYATGPANTVINAVANVDFTPVENFTIRGEAGWNPAAS